MPFSRSLRSQQGFTLVEVMVAIMLLLIGVLGAVSLIDGANRTSRTTKAREGGTNLAREVLEGARGVPYPRLTSGAITAELQAQPGLEDSNPGSAGWTIRRRGFTYTVTADACIVDDVRDGGGSHSGGGFCAESTAEATPDRNPDDYKRARVEVSWDNGPAKGRVRQSTIVNNPGSAFAPWVKTIDITSPSGLATPMITTNEPAVDFRATTSSAAETVSWSIDGTVQGPATESGSGGTLWDFSWSLSQTDSDGHPVPYDGVYQITAQAFNSTPGGGTQSGAPRTLVVTLNRFEPFKPKGFAGGRSGSIVEFEWLPSPERDILGYRVYRVVGTAGGADDVRVCPKSSSSSSELTSTECQDESPPAADSDPLNDPTYYVVAVDRAPDGSLRAGETSDLDTVADTNQPPGPVLNADAETSDGVTTLTWDPPAGGDPDGTISFYRIYRDGNNFSDRYDRLYPTGSGSLRYDDARLGGQSHTYYVTAVDNELGESALSPELVP
jgi:prepilin-type N-terminal cleavage/methylation domain-containing protein